MSTGNDIINGSEIRLRTLKKFYKNKEYLDLFVQIVTGTHKEKKLSLRILDWFVTNYAKKYDIMYKIVGNASLFDVHNEYRNQLKAFRKECFDPFCRDDRIFYPYYDEEGIKKYVETTIAQMNFFKWAISYKVIEYVINNFDDVFDDMNDANKRQRTESEKYKKLIKSSDKISKSDEDKTFKQYCKGKTSSVSSERYSLKSDLTQPLNKINILEFTSSTPKKSKKLVKKTNRKPRQELSESNSKKLNKCNTKIKIMFV
jgi:hypothetical protein